MTHEETIEACVKSVPRPFGQGDEVDMDFFVKSLPGKAQGVFSMAYQRVTPEEKNNGQSFFSCPIDIYVFEPGETNEPYKLQSPKIERAKETAEVIRKRLAEKSTLIGVYFDPVIIKTSEQMVGVRIIGTMKIKNTASICPEPVPQIPNSSD